MVIKGCHGRGKSITKRRQGRHCTRTWEAMGGLAGLVCRAETGEEAGSTSAVYLTFLGLRLIQ